jgi:hypothetical protein
MAKEPLMGRLRRVLPDLDASRAPAIAPVGDGLSGHVDHPASTGTSVAMSQVHMAFAFGDARRRWLGVRPGDEACDCDGSVGHLLSLLLPEPLGEGSSGLVTDRGHDPDPELCRARIDVLRHAGSNSVHRSGDQDIGG